MEPLRTRPWSRGARVRYFPEFKKATLDMIVSRGGVVGWTADAAAVRGALRASHGLLALYVVRCSAAAPRRASTRGHYVRGAAARTS